MPANLSALDAGRHVMPTTPTTPTTSTTGVGLERPRLRLGRTARRAVLVVHIVSAGAWIGIDVILGVLAVTAIATGSVTTEALAYQALGTFIIWPLLTAGLTALTSGLILGLGTNHGVVRYWWVAVKLVLNVVLLVLVTFALRPGLTDARTHGEALATGTPSDVSTDGLLFPPIVSLSVLVVAVILSVFKPWGRIRKG